MYEASTNPKHLFSRRHAPLSPATFLISHWWCSPESLALSIELAHHHQTLFPLHRIHFLAQTLDMHSELTRHGLRSSFINQNAFCDTNVFDLGDAPSRELDVVYNAGAVSFKNFDLTEKLKAWSWITYLYSPSQVPLYTKTSLMKNVRLAQLSTPGVGDYAESSVPVFWSPEEVASELRRHRVGLCLSTGEGAMYASVEYLLCGLSVVNVRATFGGREVFLDDYNSVKVDADPSSVRRGVKHLLARNPDPGAIRRSTLEKITSHRMRFYRVLEQSFAHVGLSIDGQAFFNQIYCHRLVNPDH
jgi:hypothetical protein